MSDARTKLLARKEQLEKEINEATTWGAAISVRYEELQGINRTLASMPEPKPEPKKRKKVDEPSTEEVVLDNTLGTEGCEI